MASRRRRRPKRLAARPDRWVAPYLPPHSVRGSSATDASPAVAVLCLSSFKEQTHQRLSVMSVTFGMSLRQLIWGRTPPFSHQWPMPNASRGVFSGLLRIRRMYEGITCVLNLLALSPRTLASLAKHSVDSGRRSGGGLIPRVSNSVSKARIESSATVEYMPMTSCGESHVVCACSD